MKIMHLIMTGGYSEGWSYQDSVLVKEHAKKHEVYVITTQYERIKDTMVKVDKACYTSELGITVYRLQHRFETLPFKIKSVLRAYKGIFPILEKIEPDVIFSHNLQYFGTGDISKYAEKNPKVRVYADNHADFSNINTSWLSVNILHKMCWRYCAQKLVPYTKIFWGVLPARVDFLQNIYGIPAEKTAYLPLGMEDDKALEAKKESNIKYYRELYGIKKEDFLIVTGGKIDKAKMQTLMLMEAVKKLDNPRLKLVIYGTVLDDMKEKFFSYVDDKQICFAGWIESDDTYKYIAAADLVVYPGRHSVLWEQTVGQGIPMVCKYWEGTTHVDLGGNVKFLYKDSTDEMMSVLDEIVNNSAVYEHMKKVAEEQGTDYFSYKNIAKQCIEMPV